MHKDLEKYMHTKIDKISVLYMKIVAQMMYVKLMPILTDTIARETIIDILIARNEKILITAMFEGIDVCDLIFKSAIKNKSQWDDELDAPMYEKVREFLESIEKDES